MSGLRIHIVGAPGSGKSTLAEILYNLLRKARYDVCIENDFPKNNLVQVAELDALPSTYLRTKVTICSTDDLTSVKDSKTPGIALTALLVLFIILSIFLPWTMPYILVSIVTSALTVVVYRATFSDDAN